MWWKNIELTRRSLVRKLDPDVFSTSTFVRSLLGYMLSERWTYPELLDIACLPGGMLVAAEDDAGGYRRLICRRNDLIRTILELAEVAQLTPAERAYLLSKVPSPHGARSRKKRR